MSLSQLLVGGASFETAFFAQPSGTTCNAKMDDGSDEMGTSGGRPAVRVTRPDTFVLRDGITRNPKPGTTPKMRARYGVTPSDIFDLHEGRLDEGRRESVAAALASGDDKLRIYSDRIRTQVEINRHNNQIRDYINGLPSAEARTLLIELCTGSDNFSSRILLGLVRRIFGEHSTQVTNTMKSLFALNHFGVVQGGSEPVMKIARQLGLID